MRGLRVVTSAMTLALLLAPTAQAQDSAEVRRLTILTFSEPVQLPGKTLPAGKYRFEMADINNAAHTVRVLSEDGQTVIGMFHTVPSSMPQRDLSDDNTLVMFAERPAGQPQAAREWFYPGRSIGEEFVYPKDQAMMIAKANNTSVAAEVDGSVTRIEGAEPVPAAASTSATASGSSAAAAQSPTPAESSAAVTSGTTAAATSGSTPAGSATTTPSANRTAPGATASAQTANEGAVPSNQPAAASAQNSAATSATAASSAQQSNVQSQQSNTATQQSSTASQQSNTAVGTSGQTAAGPAAGTPQTNTAAQQRPRTLPQTASQLYVFVLLSALSIAAAFGIRRFRLRTARG